MYILLKYACVQNIVAVSESSCHCINCHLLLSMLVTKHVMSLIESKCPTLSCATVDIQVVHIMHIHKMFGPQGTSYWEGVGYFLLGRGRVLCLSTSSLSFVIVSKIIQPSCYVRSH